MSHVLAFGMPSLPELALLAAIGLLFFGKRLPEVGRGLGQGIVEFKRGLKGIGGDIDDQVALADKEAQRRKLDQPKPKFDPYTGKPI
jgi:TatA/E family protein of Tat protein translocase